MAVKGEPLKASRVAARGMSKHRRALAVAVRELRARRGLTQEQLADAAGRSRGFVAELESGRRGASFEGVAAVAEALDVPMAELGRVFDARLAEQ
jgi:transcriptional regulator with XRE-family HTH domain